MRNLRTALILLLPALAACDVKVADPGIKTGPPITTLTLLPTGTSIVQGTSTTVLATLNKGPALVGAVNLSATTLWTGITVSVTGVQTSGSQAFATITVAVDIGVPIGHYKLPVHGTGDAGADLITEFGFDVTPAPASYTMALSTPTLTSPAGAATAPATLTVSRINLDAPITLSVDNLPQGVTASFTPPSPFSGKTTLLTLTVAGNAPPGTFTNLAVRGTTQDLFHLADVVVPFALTITP